LIQKLAVRDYLQSSGMGYTFIDVGWWQVIYLHQELQMTNKFDRMQLLLPTHKPEGSLYPEFPTINDWMKTKYASYDTRTAVTDLGDVGRFVARIVDGPITVNHYVFCWGDEVTQGDIIKTINELNPAKIDFSFVRAAFTTTYRVC
jgi:hypothetical protein